MPHGSILARAKARILTNPTAESVRPAESAFVEQGLAVSKLQQAHRNNWADHQKLLPHLWDRLLFVEHHQQVLEWVPLHF